MKILQLAQFLPPVAGGEERHVWNLARALAARSHEVTLFGFATDGAPAGTSVIDGVRVVRVRSAASRLPALYSDLSRPHALPLPDPEVSRAIAREFAVGRYDIAHAHNWIVNSALRPAAKAAVPLVMTLHDYSHVCATKRLMEHGRNQCPGPGLRRCLSCASGHYGPLNGTVTVAANAAAAYRRARRLSEVAAVSSAVADAVAIPPDHWLHRAGLSARVIPNFIPDDVVVHEIAPTQPGAPFLFAGDLSADKGVPVLLDAYRRLEAAPELILAGRIPGPEEWRFPPGARWVGQLPHEDVVGLFRSARAVVVPSVWSDPCPTVVLEAMAAGRPVVGSASGGIVDMVVDGQTGLLVPPGDAIALAEALATVLRQPESARAFGVAGRDRARKFTVNAVVPRIEQMYAEAIESGGRWVAAVEPDDAGVGNGGVRRGSLRFLLQSTASLATSTVVTAGIGFIYWAVAARSFPAVAVGESSTAISAVSLLGPLSIFGLGTLMMVRLPTLKQGRSALVSTATLAAGFNAALISLLCALFLPTSFLGIPGVGHGLLATVVFVALVVSQAICLVVDQAFLAVAGSGIQLSRNLIQSTAKLVLLGVFAATIARFGSLAIVLSWLLANVISIAAVVGTLVRRYRVSLRRALPRLSALRGMEFAAAKHHGLNTSLFVPYFAMPIVANVMLGSEQAAYLYATWSLAGFVFFLPMALAWGLFASGARDSRTFVTEFRFTLRFALAICLAAVVAIALFGGLVLGIFGPAYAENGRVVLVVLAVGGLGAVIRDHHVTLARVTENEGRESVLIALLGIAEIAGAAIGAHLGGLIGLSLGWLAAVGVEVLVCGPLVWRTYQGRVSVPAKRMIAPDAGGAEQ